GERHDEERGRLAIEHRRREADKRLVPVVEYLGRHPLRAAAEHCDAVIEIELVDADARRRRGLVEGLLALQRRFELCYLVLWVPPRNGSEVGVVVGVQLKMVGAAVSVDRKCG